MLTLALRVVEKFRLFNMGGVAVSYSVMTAAYPRTAVRLNRSLLAEPLSGSREPYQSSQLGCDTYDTLIDRARMHRGL